MKDQMKMKVSIVDMSAILKFLQKIYVDKDIIAQREWQIIEDLSKEYDTVIIPITSLNEMVVDNSDVQLRKQILRNLFNYGTKPLMSKQGVIVRNYSQDDIFEFAKNTSTEFNCPVDVITYDTSVDTRLQYVVTSFQKEKNK